MYWGHWIQNMQASMLNTCWSTGWQESQTSSWTHLWGATQVEARRGMRNWVASKPMQAMERFRASSCDNWQAILIHSRGHHKNGCDPLGDLTKHAALPRLTWQVKPADLSNSHSEHLAAKIKSRQLSCSQSKLEISTSARSDLCLAT